MNKIIIEVGSTCVKIDRYNGHNIERLDEITIQFKKHYNENHHLMEDDIKELIRKINDLKCNFSGTSSTNKNTYFIFYKSCCS